jgi:uncharacterized membrane protein YhaH (DUF805 family)
MNWYLHVLRNYVTFDGRARRKEYWMASLVHICILFGLQILEYLTATTLLASVFFIAYCVYAVATFLPFLAVSMRRLHDTGKSGWWLLILFIPLIGSIIFLIFTVREGDEGSNTYGPNPKRFL